MQLETQSVDSEAVHIQSKIQLETKKVYKRLRQSTQV